MSVVPHASVTALRGLRRQRDWHDMQAYWWVHAHALAPLADLPTLVAAYDWAAYEGTSTSIMYANEYSCGLVESIYVFLLGFVQRLRVFHPALKPARWRNTQDANRLWREIEKLPAHNPCARVELLHGLLASRKGRHCGFASMVKYPLACDIVPALEVWLQWFFASSRFTGHTLELFVGHFDPPAGAACSALLMRTGRFTVPRLVEYAIERWHDPNVAYCSHTAKRVHRGAPGVLAWLAWALQQCAAPLPHRARFNDGDMLAAALERVLDKDKERRLNRLVMQLLLSHGCPALDTK